jgi:hypothetical protein
MDVEAGSDSLFVGQDTHLQLCMYVAFGHIEHGPPGSPTKPLLQTQSVTLLEAAGDMVLLTHFTQSMLSLTDLYSSGAYGAQSPQLIP